MEKRKRKIRFLKWFSGIFLLVALLLAAASWMISIKLRPYIRQEITALVHKSTSGLYHIEFSSFHTNFITGTAVINDVKIYPDTVVFKQLIAEKKAPNNLYHIALKQLSVRHFHPLMMYFRKKAKINQLLFDKPQVTMVNRHFDFNDDRPPRPRKSPYDYISKLFSALHIETIDFKHVNFKYINNNGPVPDIDSVANLNVTFKDWLIDARSAADTSRLYLLKAIEIDLSNYRYATPDSMYFIQLDQLTFQSSTGKLNIKQLGLQPRYSEADFARVNGYARDRFTLKLNNLEWQGIDLPAYVQKQELMARKMTVSDGQLAVYNDNRFPKRSVNRTGRFPHQLLQQLRARLSVDTINLHDIDIRYSEFDAESRQTGTITFEKTGGIIRNVTNIPKKKVQNPLITADLESYVMGQGKLKVAFTFDLHSPKGAFNYTGELTHLDGRTLNRITKPLGMVQVNRGDIKSFLFNVNADEDVAKGKVEFRYQNLSVALMKKEYGKDRLVRQGLISFLANNLVIYSDNPSADGRFTAAPLQYKRETTASFFNYIWKTLFQGAKYSIGVSPVKEQEIRLQIRRFEQMKAEREERRWRRQQRKNRND